ncbi:MAG: hypothetical protein ACFFAT_22240 [Promethearchaeota archaeon]
MIDIQSSFKGKFSIQHYPNGQLAIFINDFDNFPLTELSIMDDSVELAPNEFILKDHSENTELIEYFLDYGIIESTDRFVLIGKHLSPICKLI